MFGKLYYNNENGSILACYPYDTAYSSIPEPNIEITKKQHQLLMDNQGKYIIQNDIIVEAPVIIPEPPTVEELLAFARQKRESALQSMADKYPAVRWESMTEEEKQEVKDLRRLWLDVTTQIKDGLAKDYEDIIFPNNF